jgi:hypothetical protein
MPARVPVKDVLANQAGFLEANFSPGAIAKPVHDAVVQADAGPLGFRKMEIKLAWTRTDGSKADPVRGDETLTLLNAGGSFVQSISRMSRNGIPVSQRDRVGYRNLFYLRSQDFSMKAKESGYAFVVGDLRHFDTIQPQATTLQYEYGIGFPGDTSGFAPHRMNCEIGTPYPAARAFALFQGNARDIDCEEYNSYGAMSDKSRFIYLRHYGIAIKLRFADANAIEDGKVVSASIQ